MSRSGYSDGCDGWELILWRGAVESAIRGKRGQAFLKELLQALDAMPEQKLIAGELLTEKGEVCALGSVGVRRAASVHDLQRLQDLTHDNEALSKVFGIAHALVCEIEDVNDERDWYVVPGKDLTTAEQKQEYFAHMRWKRVRQWVLEQIRDK